MNRRTHIVSEKEILIGKPTIRSACLVKRSANHGKTYEDIPRDK